MNMTAYAVRVGDLFIGVSWHYDMEMTVLTSELAHARLFTSRDAAMRYTAGDTECIADGDIQYTPYTGGRVVTVDVTSY